MTVPRFSLDDPTLREPTKHPRTVNKLRVLLIAAIAVLVGAIVLVSFAEGPVDEDALVAEQRKQQVRRTVHAPPAPEVEKAIEQKRPKSRKAMLLKEELKKREAEKKIAQAAQGKKSLGIDGADAAENTITLVGDAAFKRTLVAKLRGVRVVDQNAMFGVSLRVQNGKHGDGTLYAKCSAAIAQMPGNRLIGGLAAEATVRGDRSHTSLERDARDACAASLADDLRQWLAKR